MTRFIAVLLALGIGVVALRPLSAQQPSCLHAANESDAQRARKQQALRYTRMINSAEATVKAQGGSFQTLANLPRLGTTPEGFTAHIAVEPANYAFSVKDATDPCGFAYFSDETGLIYA